VGSKVEISSSHLGTPPRFVSGDQSPIRSVESLSPRHGLRTVQSPPSLPTFHAMSHLRERSLPIRHLLWRPNGQVSAPHSNHRELPMRRGLQLSRPWCTFLDAPGNPPISSLALCPPLNGVGLERRGHGWHFLHLPARKETMPTKHLIGARYSSPVDTDPPTVDPDLRLLEDSAFVLWSP
jgi:hypothetical protein